MLIYKKVDGPIANNLTTGSILTRIATLDVNGTPTLLEEVQIDDGSSILTFKGLITSSANAGGATVTWELFNGSSRDIIAVNRYS